MSKVRVFTGSIVSAAVAAAERQLQRSGSPALWCIDPQEDFGIACRSLCNLAGLNPALRLKMNVAGERARRERLIEARVRLIRGGVEAGEFVDGDPTVASPDATAAETADRCLRGLLVDPNLLDQPRAEVRLEGIR